MYKSFFSFPVKALLAATLMSLLVGLCATVGCGETPISASSRHSVGKKSAGKKVEKAPPSKTPEPAPEVAFLQDYKTGREIAKEKNKPILLFFYLPDCVHSQKMLNETFRNEEVLSLSERFVCIKIDVTQEKKLCKDLEVNSIPMVQFMTSQGTLLQRLAGKTPNQPNQLLVQMQVAIQSAAVNAKPRTR